MTAVKRKVPARAKVKSKAKSNAEPRKVSAAEKKRALRVIELLKEEYPDAKCALNFGGALELLVATMMAAQCTDVRVNMVTETLFKDYRSAQDYVDAPSEDLEEAIHSTGFFRQKTKSIKKCCQSLIDDHDGEVPKTMDELTHLAGVGRKTANCILGNVFNIPGIVVDTHVLRLSKRLGFTEQTDPVKVEFDLMDIVPESDWIMFSHLITDHGRKVCKARKPACDACTVADFCPKLL